MFILRLTNQKITIFYDVAAKLQDTLLKNYLERAIEVNDERIKDNNCRRREDDTRPLRPAGARQCSGENKKVRGDIPRVQGHVVNG